MNRYLKIEVVSAFLIFLFVYAAITKLTDFGHFKSVLSTSILIGKYASLVALTIPIIELAISVMLIVPLLRLLGLYASLFLLVVFTVYLVFMVLYSPNLPCSCGGILQQLSWTQHIFLNLAFISLAIVGIVLQKGLSGKACLFILN